METLLEKVKFEQKSEEWGNERNFQGKELDNVRDLRTCVYIQSLSCVWHFAITPGFPVFHNLLELAQTHVLWADNAIQPSHPLSSPSPCAFNLSQHQGLFQWVSSSHQVATVLGASTSVLPMSVQGWFPLGLAGLTPNPIWLILILWDRNGMKMTVLNHALKQLMEAGLLGPYRLKPKSFPSA